MTIHEKLDYIIGNNYSISTKPIATNLSGKSVQTIDVSAVYSNYKALKEDNFLFEIISIIGEINQSTVDGSLHPTYNNETGILTVSKGNIAMWNVANMSYYVSAYPIYNIYIK